MKVRNRKFMIASQIKNRRNGFVCGIGRLYAPVGEGSKASFWEEMSTLMAEWDIP